jgi:c-di-GMP-binding flagellar brake protein YcgR
VKASLSAPDERRQSDRYFVRFPVLVDDDSAFIVGSCLDLSSNGMALFAERAIAPGNVIAVHLALFDGQSVHCEAEVVRANGHVIGLRVLDMDEHHRRLLDEYLAQREARDRLLAQTEDTKP